VAFSSKSQKKNSLLAHFSLFLSFFFSRQKHKRKNHCDKNNDSSGNLADLSSNEDDVNIINGDFEKLQVDKPYQIKYSDIYGRFGSTS
jgi:hypothetical protein